MTFLETIEPHLSIIIQLLVFATAFVKLQQIQQEQTRRIQGIEEEMYKMREKVSNNDIALARIDVRLAGIETATLEIKTEIKTYFSHPSNFIK
jgi:hypothetical protein